MAVKQIPLTQGKFTLVDVEDYDALVKHKWHLSNTGYAKRDVNNKTLKTHYLMHRIVINAPKNKTVDHINGDTLDNRRCNLRICTSGQNIRNQKTRKYKGKSSKYKGVTWDKDTNRWAVQIQFNYKNIKIGRYILESDAALAYNKAAIKYFLEFARLNIL